MRLLYSADNRFNTGIMDISEILFGDGEIEFDHNDQDFVPDFDSDPDIESDLSYLESETADMERSESEYNPAFFGRMGSKMCPTRHGCKGATNCDYAGADYPG